jgi:phosphonate transport system substrate-binding protein
MTYRLTISPDFAQDQVGSWYLFNTWLQKRTGEAVHLELFYDFASQREAIDGDEIDLIYANAFDVVSLVRERGFRAVVAPLGQADEVVIAAPIDSGAARIESLPIGTRIAATATPDINRIGMIMLEPADLHAGNTTLVKATTYVLVAKQLLQGQADIGFFLKRAYDKLSGVIKRNLRPLVASEIDGVRHLLLAAPRAGAFVPKFEEALLTMADERNGKAVLESLGITGWVAQGAEETELMIDLIDTLQEPRQ